MRKTIMKKLLASLSLAVFLGLPLASATYAADTAEKTQPQQESVAPPARTAEQILADLEAKHAEEGKAEHVDSQEIARRMATGGSAKDGDKHLSRRDKSDLQNLKSDMYALSETQARLLEALDTLNDRIDNVSSSHRSYLEVPGPSTNRLVNPAPASAANYTQDAINSQGTSTVMFAYAPNQIYKIYCRRGYISDLAFKKGETLTFVGGGDSSSWAISTATVDGTAHLYIKPVVETSTTDLIVNTNRRSYHLILHSSNWYNPMIAWNYGDEDVAASAGLGIGAAQGMPGTAAPGGKLTPSKLSFNLTDIAEFDHDYAIKGKPEAYRPKFVFTDGTRVFMEFQRLPKQQVPLFIQPLGSKQMTLVSYQTEGNYYIVDTTFEKAQLRVNEHDTITIEHKGRK